MYDFMNPEWRQMMQGAYTIPPNPVPRYQGAVPPAQGVPPVPAAAPAQQQGAAVPWGYKFNPEGGNFDLNYSQIMPAMSPGSPDWEKFLNLQRSGAMDQSRLMSQTGGYWNGGR